MSVKFGIVQEFPYSRCRACDMKVLWFNRARAYESQTL
jgi:hypothetical protein